MNTHEAKYSEDEAQARVVEIREHYKRWKDFPTIRPSWSDLGFLLDEVSHLHTLLVNNLSREQKEQPVSAMQDDIDFLCNEVKSLKERLACFGEELLSLRSDLKKRPGGNLR